MDPVSLDQQIDRGVELDSRHLGAGKAALGVDLEDVIANDPAEAGPHAADDAGLFAV